MKKRGPAAVRSRWNGVGGKVEQGESWYDAHRRETVEETGIELMEPTEPVSEAVLNYGYAEIHFALYDLDMCPSHFALGEENDVGEPLAIRNFEAANHVENLYWIIPLLCDPDLRGELKEVRAF